MKKLLIIFIGLLFFYISSAQNANREMSNYEKYALQKEQNVAQDTITKETQIVKNKEWDDLYYSPKTDAKKVKKVRKPYVDPVQSFVDTLKQDNPNIEVNVYELDPFYYSNRIGRFYYGGFNRWMYSEPWYYNQWMYEDYGWGWNPYYGYNYPYYSGFNSGFYFGYTTFGHYWRPFPDYSWGFGFGYGYYGNHYGNNWNHYHNGYYSNNNFQHNNNMRNPGYGRQERPSSLSNTSNRQTQNRVAPQSRGTYSESRRSYTPSYNNPRMSTRPAYNNSRANTSISSIPERRVTPSTNFRTQPSTQNRTFSNTNTQSRNYSNQGSSNRREYTAPSRSSVESRNSYSNSNSNSNRSYNSSQGSSYSAPSRSYNSGSSNFSGGSSSSSGGSRSSSGSSSGSSGSSGRR